MSARYILHITVNYKKGDLCTPAARLAWKVVVRVLDQIDQLQEQLHKSDNEERKPRPRQIEKPGDIKGILYSVDRRLNMVTRTAKRIPPERPAAHLLPQLIC